MAQPSRSRPPSSSSDSPIAEGLDKRFRRLGLRSADDLLLHLPLRYEDETRLTPIARLADGVVAQVQGEIVAREPGLRGRRPLVARLRDESGELNLRFINFYPSQAEQLAPGRLVRAHGEVRGGLFGMEMVHPRYRLVSPQTPLPDRLTPVYPTSSSIPQHQLRKLVLESLRSQLAWALRKAISQWRVKNV